MKAVGDRVSFPRIAAAMAGALLLVVIACTTDPPVAADARATEAEVDTEDRGRDVVAIRVDRDGTARVNDRVVPIDLVAEVMAPYAPDAVVSLDVHEAARYGAVAALQDQLRTVGLTRVVFTLVESEDRPASAPDGSAREDNGLPVVLPEATMPDVGEVDLDPRNLLYLDVLRSGIVGARFGGDPRRPQKMTRDELELVWRRGVSLNPNLTAVVRTDPEADYEHMYDVLDALRRADAQRVSLQVAR